MQSVNGLCGNHIVCQLHTIRPYITLGTLGTLVTTPDGSTMLGLRHRRLDKPENVSDSGLLVSSPEPPALIGSVASADSLDTLGGTAPPWRRSSVKLYKPTRTGAGLYMKNSSRSGAYAKVLLSRYHTVRIGINQRKLSAW